MSKVPAFTQPPTQPFANLFTFVNLNRSSYKSKFFLLPVIAFSFLYTLPKFFELRLIKVPVGNATSNETALTFDGDLEELEFE